MTVYELIQQLSRFPADTPIAVAHHKHDYVGTVELREPAIAKSLGYTERPDLRECMIDIEKMERLDDEELENVRKLLVIG